MRAFSNTLQWVHRLALALAVLVPGFMGAGAYAQAVTALQLVPNTIAGGSGGTSTGVLSLASAAPAAGVRVQLDSANAELAATLSEVLVPSGQTQATFTVATNALYRRYSGLAFSTAISARNIASGAAVSATLNVTAQARPNVVIPHTPLLRSGPRCAGEPGVLYDCTAGPNGQCTFRQECTRGCLGQPLNNFTYQDVCAASGPYPVVTNPKTIVGGNPGGATLVLPNAAPAGSFGTVVSSSTVAAAQTRTQTPINTGATSLAMPLLTAPVNRIQFAPMDGVITTPQNNNGSTFFAERSGRAWVAVVPGAAPLAQIVLHRLEVPAVRGGTFNFGLTCLNQLAPAPDVGNFNLLLSSSNPSVAQVLPASLTPGADCLGFMVQTTAVAANTNVTIQAQLGAQTLTAPMQVTATPPATFVNTGFFNPLSVVGGQSTVATFVLDGMAPSGGFLVSLSSPNPEALQLPASITVPAGTDRVDVPITTNPVAADLYVTISPSPRAPGLTPQIQVRAASTAPVLSTLSFSPAVIAGGATTTGIVRLSGPATAPAVILLSSSSGLASVVPSVTVQPGASSASFQVSSSSVSANTVLTFSATLGSTTRLGTLTLTAGGGGGGGLTAPSLTSPADGFRFNPGQSITFDWSDVAGATGYEIQIDDSNGFGAPISLQQTTTASQWSTTLPSQRLYWRVRAVGAGGALGAWSSVRQIRPR